MKFERSKEWWLAKARREGNAVIGAGLLALDPTERVVPDEDWKQNIMTETTIVEIVRQRLTDGRHVSDADVLALVAEIDRLNKIIDDYAEVVGRSAPVTDRTEITDVWAEEAGIRIKIEKWGKGVRLTIYNIAGLSVTASVADYRWVKLMASLNEQST
jgi:hypothetical protein